jgi:hypothetical protein
MLISVPPIKIRVCSGPGMVSVLTVLAAFDALEPRLSLFEDTGAEEELGVSRELLIYGDDFDDVSDPVLAFFPTRA